MSKGCLRSVFLSSENGTLIGAQSPFTVEYKVLSIDIFVSWNWKWLQVLNQKHYLGREKTEFNIYIAFAS